MIRARDVLVAMLVLAPGVAARPAAVQAIGLDAGGVERRIAELLHEDDGGALASLGARALPELLDVLAAGAYELDGERFALDEGQREQLLRAVEAVPRASFRALLDELASPDAPLGRKAVAVEVLARNGGAADLRTMIELARCETRGAAARDLARRLEAGLARVLARDDRGYEQLAAIVRGAPEETREPSLRAMGVERSAAAIGPLAELLGTYPRADGTILEQLARIAAAQAVLPDERTLERVRKYLQCEDLRTRSTAVLVLGRFEDFRSVPALIGLLRHAHHGLRQQALWSLREISGLRLRDDPARWQAWYRSEVDWWRERSDELFADLVSTDPAVAARAVNDVARRRLFRDEIAGELLAALRHRDSRVSRQACDALRQIRSPAAVPALIDCLGQPEDELRARALAALQEITGRDLPANPEAWRSAFPD